jgi:DNA-binding transcriptional regulator YiaG
VSNGFGTDTSPLTEEELAEARRYPMTVEWSDEDQVYIVTIPDLNRIRTHGSTFEEALEMGAEAAAVWLSAMREMGYPIPDPSTAPEAAPIPRPPTFDAAQIIRIRERIGLSDIAFAALLNVEPETVRAWEQGRRAPDGAALRLLSIAAQQPETVLRAATRAVDASSLGAPSREGRAA